MLNPLLISAKDTASMLGMSRSFFYQLLSSGRVPLKSIRFGAKRLYRIKDIESYVENGCSSSWKSEKVR